MANSDRNHCPVCTYDLRGLPAPRCPECGVELTDTLFKCNRRVRYARIVCAIMAGLPLLAILSAPPEFSDTLGWVAAAMLFALLGLPPAVLSWLLYRARRNRISPDCEYMRRLVLKSWIWPGIVVLIFLIPLIRWLSSAPPR